MQQRLQSPISIVSSSLFSLSRCAAIFFPSLAVSEPRWDLPCALQGLESEPNGFAVLSSALCHTTTKSTLPLAIFQIADMRTNTYTARARACKVWVSNVLRILTFAVSDSKFASSFVSPPSANAKRTASALHDCAFHSKSPLSLRRW